VDDAVDEDFETPRTTDASETYFTAATQAALGSPRSARPIETFLTSQRWWAPSTLR